jgi:hypothetical protein
MGRWNWIIGSLTEPPKNADNATRYVQLALALALLAGAIYLRLRVPATYRGDPNGNCVVALILVLNVLAWQFRWQTRLVAGLRLLSWGGAIFVFFYVFYWSRVLYPG